MTGRHPRRYGSRNRQIQGVGATTRRFEAVSSSTLSDIMDDLGIPAVLAGIRAMTPNAKAVGPAMTVKEVSGTLGTYAQADFRVAEIIDAARPGDIVVVDNGGQQIATWGFLASFSSKIKGIAGVVVNGGSRDLREMAKIGFPVYARHVLPLSGKRRIKVESVNVPISIENVKIKPRDIIVGDETGIVVIPAEMSNQVLEQAEKIERLERKYIPLLKSGVPFSTLVRKYSHL